jgi:HicA toxin of bacterial toxin-antitoxin,
MRASEVGRPLARSSPRFGHPCFGQHATLGVACGSRPVDRRAVSLPLDALGAVCRGPRSLECPARDSRCAVELVVCEPVKRRELEKHLRTHGCREVGGAKHAKWRGPTGKASALPRHKEIGPGLARAICKQLGIPLPTAAR